MKQHEAKEQKTKKKITSKQIVAIAGIVLLVLLYVATLVAAFLDSSSSGHWFAMCLFATVVVPILIWLYTWMYGKLTQKHTFADMDLGKADSTSAADGEEK